MNKQVPAEAQAPVPFYEGQTRAATTPSMMDQAEVQDDPDDADNNHDTSLDSMSVEELQAHQEEIDRKIREKRLAQKLAVIEEIVKVVRRYEIPTDELVEALGGLKIRRKGIKAVQKYRDPSTGVTWSGRGKEPAWIRGKDRKRFEIPDTEE